jgi:hypothetical protein
VIEVYFAPEFSSVRALEERGLKSVLYHVIPRIQFDYVSYSAYESLGRPDPVASLAADLDHIRSIARTSNIILGEVGFRRSLLGDAVLAVASDVNAGAISWGVAYVIQWNLYDQDDTNDFGLFDQNGILTSLGEYYKQRLGE